MKSPHFLFTLLILCFLNVCTAQTSPIDSTEVKSDNFLDMGTEILTQTFGTNLDGNATGEKIGFLEMIDKMELPEAQKKEYRNQYYLQAKALTQKQKDSLGKAIEKKILEAERIDD